MKQNLLTHILRLTILFLLFFGGGTGSAVAGTGLECRDAKLAIPHEGASVGAETNSAIIAQGLTDWGIPSPQFDQLKLDLDAGGIPLKKFFADEGESGLKAWEACFKDATKRADIPWLSKLTESSGISKIDNANPLNVSWSNNINGQNSSVSALDFWNDVSKNFLHYEQGDFIFKYDYNSGKLLLGNKASNKIIGFYEGIENVPIGVYELSPSDIVQKLKRYHGESGPSSPIFNLPYNNQIASTPGKTTTIVGKFTYYPYFSGDMKTVVEELLGNLKTQDFGANAGGFNVLNVSDNLYDPATFWNTYNKPWLQMAINRGDEIAAASNPLEITNLFRGFNGIPQSELDILNGLSTPEQFAAYFKNLNNSLVYNQLSGFGQEFELLSKSDYILDLGTKKFIK